MPLNAVSINEKLSASERATANLSASCQGIIDTHLAPSGSVWYGTLQAELQQAQTLAQQWQTQYATRLRAAVLTCVVHCGQAFSQQRATINQLFEQASANPSDTKPDLQRELTALNASTRMIATTVASYEQELRAWGQQLERVHGQLRDTIGRIQEQEAALSSQIDSINNTIASLQSQIIADRKAIAEAKSLEHRGTLETIFGIVLAPFSGGLSLILVGIGVSSIVEAEGKVSVMGQTIRDYQARIIADQHNLTQDQAQLVTLTGLTFSAGIALSDIDVAEQMLGVVRTNWDAFFQEMDGIIAKIANAQKTDVLVLEKAWFNAACAEWDLVVTGTQGLLGAPNNVQTVTCGNCDVPVIRIVSTASHPPVPATLKVSPATGPDTLDYAPNCPVLIWGDHTYWAVDHMDNRFAMCILTVDKNNSVIRQLEKPGARYVWKMSLDQESNVVTCYGQDNKTINVSLAEIQII